jgi:hypothetical protein
MASTNTTTVTTEDLEKIYKVCYLVLSKLKGKTDLSKKSWPTILFSVICVLGMIGTLVFYIITSKIAPLMIYMACAIPVLAFGLAQFSKNLETLNKEYSEYSAAMSKLLLALTNSSTENVDELTRGLAALICAATTVVDSKVDKVTFGDLTQMDQYKEAHVLAENLATVKETIAGLKKEGLDVETLLASLDETSSTEIEQTYSELTNMLDNMTGQGVDTGTSSKTDNSTKDVSQTSESADVSESVSESESHIIEVEDDDSREDLSIVV